MKKITQKLQRINSFLSLVGLVCLMTACASTGPQHLGSTAQRDFSSSSPSPSEVAQGDEFIDELRKRGYLSTDGAKLSAVRRVAARLIRNNPSGVKSWEIAVIKSKERNAFALAGGKIGINEGMFPITQTDAGLATVISHEMAHVVSRHHAKARTQAGIMQGLGAVLGVAVAGVAPEFSGLSSDLYGGIATYGVMLPYSRSHEMEADRIGLLFMARAGYNPKESEAFWVRMAAQEKNKQRGDFASTHPADAKRIQQIQMLIPEVMPYYKKNKS